MDVRNRSVSGLVLAFALLVQSGASAAPPPTLHWIISQSSIAKLSPALGEIAIRRLFDNPSTYVIVNLPSKPDRLMHAHHVAFYRDETVMARDASAGKLAEYDGVLLDIEAYNEPGNSTPEEQKENPLPYVQDAARVLKLQGKIYLLTIGAATGTPGAFWTQTLPGIARYPDGVDFQTQAAEGTTRFQAQVARYSRVFRGNGGKLMFVGLAVAPKGRNKSASDIRSAYDSALAHQPPVDGFWFNMAVKSRSCTGCAAAMDISPGVQFFQSILQ